MSKHTKRRTGGRPPSLLDDAAVQNLVRILKNIEDLKQVPRSGDVRAGIPLVSADRIAGHIFFVSTVALLTTRFLRATGATIRFRLSKDDDFIVLSAENLDVGKVLEIALVHDWGEAFIGDVDRGAKETLRGLGLDIDSWEACLLKCLLDGPIAFPDVVACHRDFEERTSIEALIVRLADYVDAMAATFRLFSANDTRIAPRKELREQALADLRWRSPELGELFKKFISCWASRTRTRVI